MPLKQSEMLRAYSPDLGELIISFPPVGGDMVRDISIAGDSKISNSLGAAAKHALQSEGYVPDQAVFFRNWLSRWYLDIEIREPEAAVPGAIY